MIIVHLLRSREGVEKHQPQESVLPATWVLPFSTAEVTTNRKDAASAGDASAGLLENDDDDEHYISNRYFRLRR